MTVLKTRRATKKNKKKELALESCGSKRIESSFAVTERFVKNTAALGKAGEVHPGQVIFVLVQADMESSFLARNSSLISSIQPSWCRINREH